MHVPASMTSIRVLALSGLFALGTAVLAPAVQADEFTCGGVTIDRSDGTLVGVTPLLIDRADGTLLVVSALRIDKADGTLEGPSLRIDKADGTLERVFSTEGAATLTVDKADGTLVCSR